MEAEVLQPLGGRSGGCSSAYGRGRWSKQAEQLAASSAACRARIGMWPRKGHEPNRIPGPGNTKMAKCAEWGAAATMASARRRGVATAATRMKGGPAGPASTQP